MPITDQKTWDSYVSTNTDPYGGACVAVARRVMEILDEENPEDIDTHKIILRADDEAKVGGITGFMAGCAAQMIIQCHSRGKDFQKAWNKSYGVSEEESGEDGVVNPAIMTIGTKDE